MKKGLLLLAASLCMSVLAPQAASACEAIDEEDLVVIKRLQKRSGCNPISISFPKKIKIDEKWFWGGPYLTFDLVRDGEEIFSTILRERSDGDDRSAVNLCISDDLLSEGKVTITYGKTGHREVKEDGSIFVPVSMCSKSINVNNLDEKIIDSK